MLGLFSYEPIVILSNSMHPTFSKGDIIIYQKEKNNLNIGTIIVFENKNKTIIHRLIADEGTIYKTKGDNNKNVDNINISKKDIKGIYKFHIKYLGYPAIWLNNLLHNY